MITCPDEVNFKEWIALIASMASLIATFYIAIRQHKLDKDKHRLEADRFAEMYNGRYGVDRSFTDKNVSDHWPVWAEFDFNIDLK